MPTLLAHVECPSCGYNHNFCVCVAEDPPAADRGYAFTCPRTGGRTILTERFVGRPVPHPPQGAVELRPEPTPVA